MTDVWWGVVEQTPGKYNWSAYLELASLVSIFLNFFIVISKIILTHEGQASWSSHASSYVFPYPIQFEFNKYFLDKIDQCGTNVGDQCYIPLPPWVISVGNSNRTIFYLIDSFSQLLFGTPTEKEVLTLFELCSH